MIAFVVCGFVTLGIQSRYCMLFDLILKRLYYTYPTLWIELGSPLGFFFVPKESTWLQGCRARGELMNSLRKKDTPIPDWIAERPPVLSALKRLRVYEKATTTAWVILMLVFAAELIMDGF